MPSPTQTQQRTNPSNPEIFNSGHLSPLTPFTLIATTSSFNRPQLSAPALNQSPHPFIFDPAPSTPSTAAVSCLRTPQPRPASSSSPSSRYQNPRLLQSSRAPTLPRSQPSPSPEPPTTAAFPTTIAIPYCRHLHPSSRNPLAAATPPLSSFSQAIKFGVLPSIVAFDPSTRSRKKDKLRYQYPRGESYLDVIQRLEPVIIELERQCAPVVISHQALLRLLYAYFADRPLEEVPHIEVPLHTVIEIQMGVSGVEERRYKLMDCGL